MPFFVPILVGVVVAAAAGKGIQKGAQGYDAMKRAREIGGNAQARHARHVRQLESARGHMNDVLADLGGRARDINEATTGRLVKFLEHLHHTGRMPSADAFERLGFEAQEVRAFVGKYLEAGGTLRGALTASMTGAGAGSIASSLVTAFGTASTGTAISGLSGAAAQSALLAWLGGGSLAAGGGGMALGTVVMGGVLVAPAVLVGGFVLAAQGEKAVTRAIEFEVEVDRAVAQIDVLIGALHQGERRAMELRAVLEAAAERANIAIDRLCELENTFDVDVDDHVQRFQLAMVLGKTIGQLLRVKVFTDSGDIARDDSLEQIRALMEAA